LQCEAARDPGSARLLCVARGERPSLWQRLGGPGPLVVLSGPEGGFSDGEIARAVQSGFEPVGLGRRILRAETAPLLALGWISARYEAMRVQDT
jgi:16S rRNA (uracil1498-N3)-methyltransferase